MQANNRPKSFINILTEFGLTITSIDSASLNLAGLHLENKYIPTSDFL